MTQEQIKNAIEALDIALGRGGVFNPPEIDFMCDAKDALEAAQAQAGDVVITRNEQGAIVAVTRQDAEGRILEVIAEATPPAAVPETDKLIQIHDWLLSLSAYPESYPMRAMLGHLRRLQGDLSAVIATSKEVGNE